MSTKPQDRQPGPGVVDHGSPGRAGVDRPPLDPAEVRQALLFPRVKQAMRGTFLARGARVFWPEILADNLRAEVADVEAALRTLAAQGHVTLVLDVRCTEGHTVWSGAPEDVERAQLEGSVCSTCASPVMHDGEYGAELRAEVAGELAEPEADPYAARALELLAKVRERNFVRRTLALAATPGPYVVEKRAYERTTVHYWIRTRDPVEARVGAPPCQRSIAWMTGGLGQYVYPRDPNEYRGDPQIAADATFFAEARTRLPEACDDVDVLVALVGRLLQQAAAPPTPETTDRWSSLVQAWGHGELARPEIDRWVRTGLLPDGTPGDAHALRQALGNVDDSTSTRQP
jgi:hypothetical protein